MKALKSILAMMVLGMSACVAGAAVAAAVDTVPAESVNSNAVIAWASLASLAFSLVNAGYTWITNRDKVTDKKFKEQEKDFGAKYSVLKEEFQELQLDYERMRGRIDSLPTEKRMDDVVKGISAVEKDVAALTATVRAQGTALEGIAASARNISEFLLKDKTDEASRKKR